MYSSTGLYSKDDLVERHAPMVKRLAYHLVGRLPSSVQVDDLIQAGLLGLLDAAQHYDDAHGASFETYATIRIRGAMIDELRRNDWAPKSVHRRARDMAEAIRQVEARTGREALDTEVAAVMNISLDEYHQILRDSSSSRMLSVEDIGTDGNGFHEMTASAEAAPPELVADEHFRGRLAEAIAGLPERERTIMSLYYEEELNLKEIGVVFKVSESRISQIMSQAHLRLRARLADWR